MYVSIVLGQSNIWLGGYISSQVVKGLMFNTSGCDFFELNLNCLADVLMRLINIGTLVEKGNLWTSIRKVNICE